MSAQLDQSCINTLRFLSLDAIENANSGHPGLPLGAAPMAYVLWDRFLKHDPQVPDWPDRDRFVLSAGHGSMLLYALLFMTGYDLSLDDLKRFRQWGSKTPGHPERGCAPGVEITTGPLGQGLANAVGMAIAEAQLAACYNRDGHTVIDHRTWVLASDGDLMEGVAAEAVSLAGHLQLGKLTCLYDDNRVTLSAGTPMTFTEDRGARFAACGWHVQHVDDGNDLEAIDDALHAAVAETRRPSLVIVRTHIGYGSPEQDSYKAHGSPLGEDGVVATRETLGWPQQRWHIPEDAREHMRAACARGERVRAAWEQALAGHARSFPDLAAQLATRLDSRLPEGWDADIPQFEADAKGMATRVAGGKVMQAIAAHVPALAGGSADLDPSTYTALKDLGDFNPAQPDRDHQGSAGGGWSRAGRNLHFGVREHAMGAIANGLAAHGGFIPFGATFLMFSDYLRPTLRLAALSKLHVIHVFTHDSIGLGEDGPTHQPVEHLASLRAIPGLSVIRPADANETAVAWQVAMAAQDHPVALVFSRQALPTLDRDLFAAADGLRRGAYVLNPQVREPQLILMASGSEVQLIVAASAILADRGVAVRCVSFPSWDLFCARDQQWHDAVLPPSVTARLAVEAGATQGWHEYVGPQGAVLGLDRYGASAPGETNMEHFGFTVGQVIAQAQSLLEGHQHRVCES